MINRTILTQLRVLRHIKFHHSKIPLSYDARLDAQASKLTGMAETHYNVDHDTKNNLFFITLKDSEGKAKLEYDWITPTFVDMYHTEVPPQFQGKGIAKHLAKAAFDYFSENKITMRPSCTYLQKYFRENPLPKYMDHMEKKFMPRH